MIKKEKLCKFCGAFGFHPEAHIWPKSLYLGDKGIPYKLFKLSGNERVMRSPTGLYDSNLWCEKCEKKSAKLDGYISKYLPHIKKHLSPYVGSNDKPLVQPNGQTAIWTINNIDPEKLHLFIVSVLWRASASKRREVAGFNLGPYENRFREILIASNCSDLEKYPYIIMHEQDVEMRSGFISPARTKYDDVGFVRFYGGGFRFDIKVSNREIPSYLAPLANGRTRPILLTPYKFLATRDGKKIAYSAQKSNNAIMRRKMG